MSLEHVLKNIKKGKGDQKRHNWLVDLFFNELLKTNPVAIYKEMDLVKTNEFGEDYVVGEIDILVVREQGLEIYSVKSGGFHWDTIYYQSKKETGFVWTEMAGANLRYFVINPGTFFLHSPRQYLSINRGLGEMFSEVKVW